MATCTYGARAPEIPAFSADRATAPLPEITGVLAPLTRTPGGACAPITRAPRRPWPYEWSRAGEFWGWAGRTLGAPACTAAGAPRVRPVAVRRTRRPGNRGTAPRTRKASSATSTDADPCCRACTTPSTTAPPTGRSSRSAWTTRSCPTTRSCSVTSSCRTPGGRTSPGRWRRCRRPAPTASPYAGSTWTGPSPSSSASRPRTPPGRRNTRPAPRHDVHTPRKTQSAKQRTKKSTAPRPRRTG